MTNRPAKSSGRSKSKDAVAEISEGVPTTMTTDTGVKIDLTTRVMLPVSIPIGLKIELEKFAESNNTEATDVARKAIADAVGYDLPVMSRGRRASSLTDEEKKEKARQRNEERRDAVKALLGQYGVSTGKK